MTAVTNQPLQAPNFAGLNWPGAQPAAETPSIAQAQQDVERFNALTNAENITTYAHGANLTDLTALAERVVNVILDSRCCPFWTGPAIAEDRDATVRMVQWQMDHLSQIKERLGQAVEQKRNYYQNDWFGILTQYFLKCFCMWNGGQTASIKTGESFLYTYESRPRRDRGYTVGNLPHPNVFMRNNIQDNWDWIRNDINLTQFYNYDPNPNVREDILAGQRV